MIPAGTKAQIREAEEKYFSEVGSPISLMELVGKSIADEVKDYSNILIICGSGNNAGDGFAACEMLLKMQKRVSLLLLSNKTTSAGKYFLDKCKINGVICIYSYKDVDFAQYDIIVDCVYGIGFHGPLSHLDDELFSLINNSGKRVVSVDIPSGLCADNGLSENAIIADTVLTVGAMKPGLFLNSGKDYCKSIKIIPFDLPIRSNIEIFDKKDCTYFLRPRKNNSHKGIYGYITLFGGCKNYSGAIKLANLSSSAMFSGSGVVRLAVPDEIFSYVAPYLLTSTLFSETETDTVLSKASAVGIGCGWGRGEDRITLLQNIISKADCPIILDADGLYAWKKAGFPNCKNQLIITPHLSEMSFISDKSIQDISSDPIASAMEFSSSHQCITVLKGPSTIITDGQNVILSPAGCAGMATAGSGDVLLGIMTAVLGQNHEYLLKSVAYATYIAGLSGELAQKEYTDIGMTSKDTIDFIRPALKFLRNACGII